MSRIMFDPPLWLQRQAWILSQLALVTSESILEVGCGESPLLHAILEPPLYIAPSKKWREAGARATGLPGHTIFQSGVVAPKKIVLLDISAKALKKPIKTIKKEISRRNGPCGDQRWYDMQVKTLCGSLDDNLSEQVGQVDVIVASEVIEHLLDPVFSNFAPSLLGRCRPKVLLLTTPNYTFNENFNERNGFIDPTGRTVRVFRHDDHKLEWTKEEFEQWCTQVAVTYRYTVSTSGIGEALNAIQTEANADRRFATQTAVFTRLDDEVSMMARLAVAPEGAIEPRLEYEATFQAAQPSPFEVGSADIASLTRELVSCLPHCENVDEDTCQALLWSVWMHDDLRRLCQGSIELWMAKLGITFSGDEVQSGEDAQLIVSGSDLYLCCKSSSLSGVVPTD